MKSLLSHVLVGQLDERLKPCPFCRGQAREIRVSGPLPHVVECIFCHARTARCKESRFAFLAWNKREG
jgi:hypothetical protein